ncbi:MAG: hypothetical protein ACTHMU_03675 [Thermomicrobiales bacterium]
MSGQEFDALRELQEMVARHGNTYGAYQDEVPATLPFAVLLQLTEAVEQLTRARDLLAGSLAREQVANGRLRAALEKAAVRREYWKGGDGAGGYACTLCPAQALEPEWLQHHADCPLSGTAPHFVRCTICGARHDETYPYLPEPGKFGGRTSASDRQAATTSAPTDAQQGAETCPHCLGKGYIAGEYRFDDGRVYRQSEPCGECAGTGQVPAPADAQEG